LLNLGINLRRVNNYRESIDNLKKAADLIPNKAQAQNNLGLSYFESMEFDEALICYNKAINIETQTTTESNVSRDYLSLYLNNRGLTYYHLQEYDNAIKDYQDAIESVGGTNAENFFNLGNVYLTLNDFTKAHENFDEAIRIDPKSAKNYHAKGLAFQTEAEKKALKLKDEKNQKNDAL